MAAEGALLSAMVTMAWLPISESMFYQPARANRNHGELSRDAQVLKG